MSDISPNFSFYPKTGFYERNCEVLEPGLLPQGMRRVALCVEYNGAAFHGFQRQSSGIATVQQALETALTSVANEPITLVCAGRTDTGVHATQQIVHFDTLAKRMEKAWVMGVNTQLPYGVGVRWSREVAPNFHARFSATARVYRYLICNTSYRPALQYEQLTWEKRDLNIIKMQQAACLLVGRHDFTSFRAAQCQAKSPVRDIHHFHIIRKGDLIILEVKANAFLHHMVRNMVGVLLDVGVGERPVEWVTELLQINDRTQASATAKPNGLHLVNVIYPENVNLPVTSAGPSFIDIPVGSLLTA